MFLLAPIVEQFIEEDRNMKKPEVITAVAEATGITKGQVEKTLDAFTGEILAAMARGEEVSYPNIGKFQPKTQAARVARNPHTGETISVPAKKVVKFTISKPLKESAG